MRMIACTVFHDNHLIITWPKNLLQFLFSEGLFITKCTMCGQKQEVDVEKRVILSQLCQWISLWCSWPV